MYLDNVSATHYESLTRGKSPADASRMRFDWDNNLIPYIRSLSAGDIGKIVTATNPGTRDKSINYDNKIYNKVRDMEVSQ